MRRTALALVSAGVLLGAAVVSWPLEAVPTFEAPDPLVVVGRITPLARLETASVPVTTTLHSRRGEGFVGVAMGEELVFQGVGEVVAGVDLDQLQPDDVWVDTHGVVWVALPPAEIFSVTLDEARSQVLYRHQGWFAWADPDFESQARRRAVVQLEDQARRSAVLDVARDQAETALRELLSSAGIDAVRFVAKASPRT